MLLVASVNIIPAAFWMVRHVFGMNVCMEGKEYETMDGKGRSGLSHWEARNVSILPQRPVPQQFCKLFKL